MNTNIVYILTNESMPNYVKIGYTQDSLESRMKSLCSTGVPLPFECHYACTVKNASETEKWIHRVFADRRVAKKEFFLIDPECAVTALKVFEVTQITPSSNKFATKEELKEIENIKAKRSKFDFKENNIPIGSILEFSRNKEITCTVLANNKIDLNGKISSLSLSARELLGYKYGVAGTLYWMYDGETLDSIRKNKEN